MSDSPSLRGSLSQGNNNAANIALVTVELYDDSNFKTSLQQYTTPRSLIKLTARKRGLTQIDCFGLQVPRGILSGAIAMTGAIPEGEDDRVFLLDDVAIADQVFISPKFKIQVAMKYAYVDIKRDITDEKAIPMLFGEMCHKLKVTASNVNGIKDEQVQQLVAIQVHCKNVSNPGKSYLDDAKEVLPKWMEATVNEEFYEAALSQVKAMSNLSYTDAAKRLLSSVRVWFPQWFITKYDVLHADQSASLQLIASTEGLYVNSQSADKSAQKLYITYKSLSRWSYIAEDEAGGAVSSGSNPKALHSKNQRQSMLSGVSDDQQSVHISQESLANPQGNMRSSASVKNFDGNESIRGNSPVVEGNSPKKSGGMSIGNGMKTVGRFSLTRKNAPGKMSLQEQMGTLVKEKSYRYALTLSFNQDYLYPVELIVLSAMPNDMRLKELIDHYSGKNVKNADIDADDEVDILDDPRKVTGQVTCVANQDYEAKAEEELMFLSGETIIVTKKLDNGFYMGTCQNIEGVFRGSMVTFPRRDKDTAMQTKRRNMLLMQISKPKAVEQRVEVVHLHFIDETRKSLKINDKITGRQLIRMMAEKLELSDCDFFGISVVVDNNERWLKPNIVVLSQLVPDCKLYFKIRTWYYDSSDLEDKMMSYLFYLQVKQFVLSGFDNLDESEVIEFGSLQLQAAYGDHDSEKHKVGTIGSVTNYLPPNQQKFTMSRSENWWQKKLLSAHQQHKGLSKTEAEKAYISTSQKLPHYGYTLHSSLLPDNVYIAISRDNIAIIDKNNKAFVEKFPSAADVFTYSNSSLITEFKATVESVAKRYTFFSLQTPDIMEVLHMLTIADTRSQMRKKCRQIREKFSLVGMIVELDGDIADKYLKDPEYFARYLRNGVAFRLLLDGLDKPLPTSGPFTQPTTIQGGDSPSSDLPTYSCMEKIQGFLNHARDVLGMSEADLFLPEELYSYSLTSFMTVLDSLQGFFECQPVAAKLKEIQDYNTKNKIRKGASSAATSPGVSSAPMTQEDFMRRVMEELMMTEVNYAKDMDATVQTWFKPLKQRVDSQGVEKNGQRTLEAEVLDMFGNADEVSEFHQQISKKLQEIGTNIEKVGEIGKLFSSRSDQFITLYEIYCSNHAEPADRMPDISGNSELMSIMGLSADAQASQLSMRNLSSQLIKPVQRIMRYHLLLKELVRYTLESHPGYNTLENGLNKMKEVASAVNEIKRKKENQRTLDELQDRIESYQGPPIQAFGALIQDGNLIMVDKTGYSVKNKALLTNKENMFHFFLFEEVILFCKENSKKKAGDSAFGYKFKGLIPMVMVVVKDNVADLGNGDELKFCWELARMDTQKTYIMASTTFEEKDRWVTQVNECAEKIATRPSSKDNGIDWKKFKMGESFASIDSTSSKKSNASAFQFSMRTGKGKKAKDSLAEEGEQQSNISTPTSGPTSATVAPLHFAPPPSSAPPKAEGGDGKLASLVSKLEDLSAIQAKLQEENNILNESVKRELKNAQQLESEILTVKTRNESLESIIKTIAKTDSLRIVTNASDAPSRSDLSAQIAALKEAISGMTVEQQN